MKKCYPLTFLFTLLFFISLFAKGQAVLIDHNFQVNSLPGGVTSDGVISPTKAADGVCSMGMIQVNSGGYLQADVSSCGVFTVNMKSTSSSTRLVTIKYKKEGETAYTVVSTNLAVSTAASFNITTLFPSVASQVPVSVRIEPTNGNIQIHDLFVQSNASQSNAAEITGFRVPGQMGNEVINTTSATVAINVPMGTPLNALVPESITLSPQANISPAAASPRNFSAPVVYLVTAQNGAVKSWTVTIHQVASSQKEITSFKLANNQVGESLINTETQTITLNMPVGSNLDNLVPATLSVSANSTVNPGANSAQNFSAPVSYTVTAQDLSSATWRVTVTLVDPNAVYTDYQAEDAAFTGTVDNNHAGYTGTGFINFLAAENYIIYTVCVQQAGTQTAKFRYSLANDNSRKGKLYLNDVFIKVLDFARTASYTEWVDETASLSLMGGVNTIKITWDTTDGPNMDKMMLSGAPCASYILNVAATNGGTVNISPARTNGKYFEGETATLLAVNTPSSRFLNWSGDLAGNTNPAVITINSNKSVIANFNTIPTYKLIVNISGIGEVVVSPAGGEYAEGTVVTLTPKSVLGSSFTGWSGDLSSSASPATVTMSSAKNVTASFSSTYTFNFERVTGFAAMSGDGFAGATRGGQCAADTLKVNGPADFNLLCEALYNRQQAYKNNQTVGGMKKAPLVILLRAGIYDGTQALSTNGAKVFANSMLDIPEQGDLSFVGETGVLFKIGINVKRAYNLLIRNISFQDYYDDGINIGGSETHHIWIDHCTVGHPTTKPADSEHPDGGIDIKDGASYVTISWCLYRNSWKTGLVGHSDNNGPTDAGRLKVTYLNNYFTGTNSRNPRVRFGEVHLLNNLLENVGLYGTAAANSAWVYAENNFYLNTHWPMYADRSVADFKAVFGNNSDGVYTSKTGNYPAFGLKQVGNGYDDSGLPVITAQINPSMLNPGGRSVKFDELNPAAVFTPSAYYDYTSLTAEEVRAIVPVFAGADKVNFMNAGCSALPVSLLSFKAFLFNGNKEAAVTWQTSSEKNTKEFAIEKSINGIAFQNIGQVSSRNLGGVTTYTFSDKNVAQGISYYRLKMIDRDGSFVYSGTAAVNNKTTGLSSAYPNPVNGNLLITHNKAVAGSTFKLVAIDGRIAMRFNAQQGSVTTPVNVSSMAAGHYMLLFQNGTERTSTKLVKQ